MEIYLQYNEEEWGPYSEEDIISMLKSGEISRTDLIWYEGLEDWEPINEALEIPITKRPPPIKKAKPVTGNEIVVAEPYKPPSKQNPYKKRKTVGHTRSQPVIQKDQHTNQQVIINQQPTEKSNGMGTAGFVLAIIGLFICWIPFLNFLIWGLGFLFSFIGLFKAPRGFAITGFVISMISIIILIFVITAITAAFSSAFS